MPVADMLRRARAVGMAGVFRLRHGGSAHGFAGARFFPATIATDDLFVADELAPTAWFKDAGDVKTTNYSVDFAKRITSISGLEFGTYLAPPPDPTSTASQPPREYQLAVDAMHETFFPSESMSILGHGYKPHRRRGFAPSPAFFGKGLAIWRIA